MKFATSAWVQEPTLLGLAREAVRRRRGEIYRALNLSSDGFDKSNSYMPSNRDAAIVFVGRTREAVHRKKEIIFIRRTTLTGSVRPTLAKSNNRKLICHN